MREGNPGPAEIPRRIARLLDALDRLVFREPDLRATARGWQVRRPRRFIREYRDPRWNLVALCAACAGTGAVGAHGCPDCGGTGRVMRQVDGQVAVR